MLCELVKLEDVIEFVVHNPVIQHFQYLILLLRDLALGGFSVGASGGAQARQEKAGGGVRGQTQQGAVLKHTHTHCGVCSQTVILKLCMQGRVPL